MRTLNFWYALALCSLSYVMSSCSVIGDIFEAGVWVGIIIVVAVIALIIWAVSKFVS